MSNQDHTLYARSQGLTLLEAAVQRLGPIFSIVQLMPMASGMQISRSQLRWLLSELTRSGWLESIKRGTYAVKSTLFAGEISPLAVAAALVQPLAISHWSAMAHHGFTTQIPVMVQASTPRKLVTPEMRSGQANSPRGRAVWKALGVEVEFIHIQSRHFFGHQLIWVNNWQRVPLTDPERTALDLIARPDIFGGMSGAIEILEGALPRLNLATLTQYALQYDTGATIKRLGWVLEQLGAPSETLVDLQAYPVTTYHHLDPQGPKSARYNARWKIIENMRRENA